MDEDEKENMIKRLKEKAWGELIEESLVRKEGENYIWNSEGIIESYKIG